MRKPGVDRTLALALLAPSGLLTSAALQAQTEPDTDTVVVVGSRLGADEFVPRNVVVRGRESIETSMPGDAEQLLGRLPGVALFRPGGAGGVSEIFVRGGESNFTAVYLDGVRLNDATNTRGGSFDFSTLPAFRIDRIELAPGAMSAVYGADAMAGVIQIATAWPEAGDWLARAEIGSENDWRAGLGSTFAIGDKLSLGLIGMAGDGGDEIEGSTLETTELGARLLINPGDSGHDSGQWTLIGRFAERDRKSFPEVSGGPLYAVLRELEASESEQQSFSAATGWTFSEAWTAELTISRAETEEDFRSPPIAPGILDGQPAFSTETDFDRSEILFVNRYRIDETQQLAFGVDVVLEDGSDDGSIDVGILLPAAYQLDRDTRSLFGEFGKRFNAGFDLTFALRTDRTGDDRETSGKLGVSKALGSIDGRIWATAATGFKLPSFFALGNPLYGNPNLAPEQVESIEIGFEHAPAASLSYGFSTFANAYEDLIDFDFETFTSVNRASVDIDGAQAWFRWTVNEALTVLADATVLSIATGEGSTALPRRPEEMAGIRVERQFGEGWTAVGSLRHVGSRTLSSIPTGTIEDGSYRMADVAFRKSTEDGLSYWFALDNLFDANYVHAPGFPAPGTRVRVGAEVDW